MDKEYIIANWKMNLAADEAVSLAQEIAKSAVGYESQAEIILCPSFDSLREVAAAVKNSAVKVGAQDCFWEAEGAYTGEISPKYLAQNGAKYVIIGHSERRQHLGETNQHINLKIKAALRSGLTPILCVGETFEDRQDGQKDFVLMKQLAEALAGIKLLTGDFLMVAYEPVWVIGSGQAVAPEEAEHTSRVVEQCLLDAFGVEQAKKQTAIIYGGSVNEANVQSFLNQPTITGVLVGTASLQAKTFLEIIKATA